MTSPLENLLKAKELMLEAEETLINEKKFCPYEIGFTLRRLEEAIEKLAELEK